MSRVDNAITQGEGGEKVGWRGERQRRQAVKRENPFTACDESDQVWEAGGRVHFNAQPLYTASIHLPALQGGVGESSA